MHLDYIMSGRGAAGQSTFNSFFTTEITKRWLAAPHTSAWLPSARRDLVMGSVPHQVRLEKLKVDLGNLAWNEDQEKRHGESEGGMRC